MILTIVRPYHPPLGKFATEFNRAIASGHVTNNGSYVQAFERELTAIMGAPVLCFSSGMAALVAMLMASDVAGMEVICPSFTFCATPHAIKLAGATPVFADIDRETMTLDVTDVERRITHRTAAIMPVDPYGICFDPPKSWEGIDTPVLIDSAPAFGSTVNGSIKPRGHAQIFSFHATKPFSVMEGGALCSDNEGIIHRAKMIRNFGQDDGSHCSTIGFNGKMAEVNAIMGLKQLETWQHRASARESSAFRLRQALNIPGVKVVIAPLGQDPIWTYQPILVADRDRVALHLASMGVMSRKYYPACHLMEPYHNDFVEVGVSGTPSLPVTEHVAAQVLALPVYDEMTDDEIGQIAQALWGAQCAS
jgi:dTDP-4-amino-4,6-dideoxygalactose transaminase